MSLIPFKNDSEHFEDMPDIYCTAQEFLDLRAGDFEEHAILLCGYFNYIDASFFKDKLFKNYLVFGRGLPEGKTIYVMRRDNQSVELWNPQTGEPYFFNNVEEYRKFCCFTVSAGFKNKVDLSDLACPLKSIGCVIDDQNIYVNIQQFDDPSYMDFNIDDPRKWHPFMTTD